MNNTCTKCGHWNGGVVLCKHYAEEAERRERERQGDAELKSLIEDAARLLGLEVVDWRSNTPVAADNQGLLTGFNPLDPERGDLMKVARVAKLSLLYGEDCAAYRTDLGGFVDFAFTEGDYESEALAILRAASAVLHSRGGV